MPIDKKYIDAFINVTSKAALASHYHVGKKDKIAADKAAVDSMRSQLNKIDMKGQIVIGATGNIGIEHSSPEGRLHVYSTNRYIQELEAQSGITAGTTSGTIYRQQYTTTAGSSRRMAFFGIKRIGGTGGEFPQRGKVKYFKQGLAIQRGSKGNKRSTWRSTKNKRKHFKLKGRIRFQKIPSIQIKNFRKPIRRSKL